MIVLTFASSLLTGEQAWCIHRRQQPVADIERRRSGEIMAADW